MAIKSKSVRRASKVANSAKKYQKMTPDDVVRNAKQPTRYAVKVGMTIAPFHTKTIQSFAKQHRELQNWLRNSSPFRTGQGAVSPNERLIRNNAKTVLSALRTDIKKGHLLDFRNTNNALSKAIGGIAEEGFDDTYDALDMGDGESPRPQAESSGPANIDDLVGNLLGDDTFLQATEVSTSATLEAIDNSTSAMTNATMNAADYSSNKVVAGVNVAISHMAEYQMQTNDILGNIDRNISSLVEQNNSNYEFQSQTLDFFSKTEGSLNQIVELLKYGTGKMEDNYGGGSREDKYDFLAGGKFDVKKFMANAVENSVVGQLGTMYASSIAPYLKLVGIDLNKITKGRIDSSGEIDFNPAKMLFNKSSLKKHIELSKKNVEVSMRALFDKLATSQFKTGNDFIDEMLDAAAQMGLLGHFRSGRKGYVEGRRYNGEIAHLTDSTIGAIEHVIPQYLSHIERDISLIAKGLFNGAIAQTFTILNPETSVETRYMKELARRHGMDDFYDNPPPPPPYGGGGSYGVGYMYPTQNDPYPIVEGSRGHIVASSYNHQQEQTQSKQETKKTEKAKKVKPPTSAERTMIKFYTDSEREEADKTRDAKGKAKWAYKEELKKRLQQELDEKETLVSGAVQKDGKRVGGIIDSKWVTKSVRETKRNEVKRARKKTETKLLNKIEARKDLSSFEDLLQHLDESEFYKKISEIYKDSPEHKAAIKRLEDDEKKKAEEIEETYKRHSDEKRSVQSYFGYDSGRGNDSDTKVQYIKNMYKRYKESSKFLDEMNKIYGGDEISYDNARIMDYQTGKFVTRELAVKDMEEEVQGIVKSAQRDFLDNYLAIVGDKIDQKIDGVSRYDKLMEYVKKYSIQSNTSPANDPNAFRELYDLAFRPEGVMQLDEAYDTDKFTFDEAKAALLDTFVKFVDGDAVAIERIRDYNERISKGNSAITQFLMNDRIEKDNMTKTIKNLQTLANHKEFSMYRSFKTSQGTIPEQCEAWLQGLDDLLAEKPRLAESKKEEAREKAKALTDARCDIESASSDKDRKKLRKTFKKKLSLWKMSDIGKEYPFFEDETGDTVDFIYTKGVTADIGKKLRSLDAFKIAETMGISMDDDMKEEYKNYNFKKAIMYAADMMTGGSGSSDSSESEGSGYGRSVGKGPSINHYSQASYGNISYGDTTMSAGACGPVALANVFNRFGIDVDPITVARISEAMGYAVDGGTSAGLFTTGTGMMGLNGKAIKLSDVSKALSNGNQVILSGKSMGGGLYTSAGHIISLNGISGKNVGVDDPLKASSEVRNLSEVLRGANHAWSVGRGPGATTGGIGEAEGSDPDESIKNGSLFNSITGPLREEENLRRVLKEADTAGQQQLLILGEIWKNIKSLAGDTKDSLFKSAKDKSDSTKSFKNRILKALIGEKGENGEYSGGLIGKDKINAFIGQKNDIVGIVKKHTVDKLAGPDGKISLTGMAKDIYSKHKRGPNGEAPDIYDYSEYADELSNRGIKIEGWRFDNDYKYWCFVYYKKPANTNSYKRISYPTNLDDPNLIPPQNLTEEICKMLIRGYQRDVGFTIRQAHFDAVVALKKSRGEKAPDEKSIGDYNMIGKREARMLAWHWDNANNCWALSFRDKNGKKQETAFPQYNDPNSPPSTDSTTSSFNYSREMMRSERVGTKRQTKKAKKLTGLKNTLDENGNILGQHRIASAFEDAAYDALDNVEDIAKKGRARSILFGLLGWKMMGFGAIIPAMLAGTAIGAFEKSDFGKDLKSRVFGGIDAKGDKHKGLFGGALGKIAKMITGGNAIGGIVGAILGGIIGGPGAMLHGAAVLGHITSRNSPIKKLILGSKKDGVKTEGLASKAWKLYTKSVWSKGGRLGGLAGSIFGLAHGGILGSIAAGTIGNKVIQPAFGKATSAVKNINLNRQRRNILRNADERDPKALRKAVRQAYGRKFVAHTGDYDILEFVKADTETQRQIAQECAENGWSLGQYMNQNTDRLSSNDSDESEGYGRGNKRKRKKRAKRQHETEQAMNVSREATSAPSISSAELKALDQAEKLDTEAKEANIETPQAIAKLTETIVKIESDKKHAENVKERKNIIKAKKDKEAAETDKIIHNKANSAKQEDFDADDVFLSAASAALPPPYNILTKLYQNSFLSDINIPKLLLGGIGIMTLLGNTKIGQFLTKGASKLFGFVTEGISGAIKNIDWSSVIESVSAGIGNVLSTVSNGVGTVIDIMTNNRTDFATKDANGNRTANAFDNMAGISYTHEYDEATGEFITTKHQDLAQSTILDSVAGVANNKAIRGGLRANLLLNHNAKLGQVAGDLAGIYNLEAGTQLATYRTVDNRAVTEMYDMIKVREGKLMKRLHSIADKIGDLVEDHFGKSVREGGSAFLGKLKSGVGKVITKFKSVIGGTKFGQWIATHADDLSKKLTALMSKEAFKTAMVAALVVDVIYRATSGAAWGASTLFHVQEKDVDATMRMISSLMAAAGATTLFAVLELLDDILYSVTGWSFKHNIAVAIYKAINSDEADKLDKAIASQETRLDIYNSFADDKVNMAQFEEITKKNGWLDNWRAGWDSMFGTNLDKRGAEREKINSQINQIEAQQIVADIKSQYQNQSVESMAAESEGYGNSSVGYGHSSDNHYSQLDKSWRNIQFGKMNSGTSTTIGTGGCGPTALANVARNLTGNKRITPTTVASMAQDYGYTANGGSAASLFTEGANRLGLSSRRIGLRSVPQALASGHKLILSGKRVGSGSPYTDAGHIISINGIKNGKAIVDDPLKSTSQTMSLNKVLTGARKVWAVDKGNVGYGTTDPEEYLSNLESMGYGYDSKGILYSLDEVYNEATGEFIGDQYDKLAATLIKRNGEPSIAAYQQGAWGGDKGKSNAWAHKKFTTANGSTSTFQDAGCYPTALANALSNATRLDIDPVIINKLFPKFVVGEQGIADVMKEIESTIYKGSLPEDAFFIDIPNSEEDLQKLKKSHMRDNYLRSIANVLANGGSIWLNGIENSGDGIWAPFEYPKSVAAERSRRNKGHATSAYGYKPPTENDIAEGNPFGYTYMVDPGTGMSHHKLENMLMPIPELFNPIVSSTSGQLGFRRIMAFPKVGIQNMSTIGEAVKNIYTEHGESGERLYEGNQLNDPGLNYVGASGDEIPWDDDSFTGKLSQLMQMLGDIASGMLEKIFGGTYKSVFGDSTASGGSGSGSSDGNSTTYARTFTKKNADQWEAAARRIWDINDKEQVSKELLNIYSRKEPDSMKWLSERLITQNRLKFNGLTQEMYSFKDGSATDLENERLAKINADLFEYLGKISGYWHQHQQQGFIPEMGSNGNWPWVQLAEKAENMSWHEEAKKQQLSGTFGGWDYSRSGVIDPTVEDKLVNAVATSIFKHECAGNPYQAYHLAGENSITFGFPAFYQWNAAEVLERMRRMHPDPDSAAITRDDISTIYQGGFGSSTQLSKNLRSKITGFLDTNRDLSDRAQIPAWYQLISNVYLDRVFKRIKSGKKTDLRAAAIYGEFAGVAPYSSVFDNITDEAWSSPQGMATYLYNKAPNLNSRYYDGYRNRILDAYQGIMGGQHPDYNWVSAMGDWGSESKAGFKDFRETDGVVVGGSEGYGDLSGDTGFDLSNVDSKVNRIINLKGSEGFGSNNSMRISTNRSYSPNIRTSNNVNAPVDVNVDLAKVESSARVMVALLERIANNTGKSANSGTTTINNITEHNERVGYGDVNLNNTQAKLPPVQKINNNRVDRFRQIHNSIARSVRA